MSRKGAKNWGEAYDTIIFKKLRGPKKKKIVNYMFSYNIFMLYFLF